MPSTTGVKGSAAARDKGIDHTFDRNGALVVNPYSLLTNKSFLGQIKAAAKLGRLQDRVRAQATAGKK